jgi:hypothetical protein
MTSEQLKDQTKKFAVRTIKLVDALPRDLAAQVVSRQLLPSATSAGADYRAACRPMVRKETAYEVR